MYKVALLTGVAAGYVLGARAGRTRYDQIATAVRGLMDKPAVQETAGVLQGQAAGLASAAKQTVSSKVGGRLRPGASPQTVPGPVVEPYADPSLGTPAAGGFGTDTTTGTDFTGGTQALDADPLTGRSSTSGL